MEQKRKRGRPRKFHRVDVINAAKELINRSSLEELSMKQLATELDCATMTLYGYVSGRDDLILLVGESHISSLAERLDEAADENGGWKAELRSWVDTVLEYIADEPGFVQILRAGVPEQSESWDAVYVPLTKAIRGSGVTEDVARRHAEYVAKSMLGMISMRGVQGPGSASATDTASLFDVALRTNIEALAACS